ncbi:MAG: hypothetical protein HN368_01980, partial [Spirochaetales bacterium]|nr:hypothetical protein [Spirochaetales bacterium]
MASNRRVIRKTLLVLLFLAAGSSGFSQSTELNLDDHYKFPFSFGVEYQSLSPLGDFGGTGMDITAFDIGAVFRYPLPFLPVIQPILQLGAMNFDLAARNGDPRLENQYDHTQIYGLLGAGYMTRFSKTLELGGELALGYSLGIFRNFDPEDLEAVYGSPSFAASLGGRVALIPSYNMSINVHPNVKFLYSSSALTRFNGFLFNIGISVSYRLGEDPDTASSIVRSIDFDEVEIQPLFAALQTYYTQNSIGTARITNTEKFSIYDIVLTFDHEDLMDNPKEIGVIDELAPGESREVEIKPTFNDEIFKIEGQANQSSKISAVYVSNNRTVEQSTTVEYMLHDKTSLTWTEDEKIAGYITPRDSTLDNYTKQMVQITKNDINDGLSLRLQNAMQLYAGLSEQGILYKVDPISAFDSAQGDSTIIDSISLPRDTLKFVTGDCDDLTVLYNSLLEIAGMPTGFITTPGHIFSAFNTGVPLDRYRSIHPDRNMTLGFEGELWIPVEITMLGTEDFMTAWRTGAEEWNEYENDSSMRYFAQTKEAQKTYPPIVLESKDMGIQYADARNVVER